jgi:hypothetical protein
VLGTAFSALVNSLVYCISGGKDVGGLPASRTQVGQAIPWSNAQIRDGEVKIVDAYVRASRSNVTAHDRFRLGIDGERPATQVYVEGFISMIAATKGARPTGVAIAKFRWRWWRVYWVQVYLESAGAL